MVVQGKVLSIRKGSKLGLLIAMLFVQLKKPQLRRHGTAFMLQWKYVGPPRNTSGDVKPGGGTIVLTML